MILFDANFLIAYFNDDDVHHKKAVELSEKIRDYSDNFIVLDHIFDEVIGVCLRLLKDINKVKIIGNDIISTIGVTHINEDTFNKAWEVFSNQKQTKFSFTDCIIIAYMDIYKIRDLITFDKEFLNIKSINVVM
ncbi:MAG: PIN domain-containing protein [archaeon]